MWDDIASIEAPSCMVVEAKLAALKNSGNHNASSRQMSFFKSGFYLIHKMKR